MKCSLSVLALLPIVAALSGCGGSGATPESALPTTQTFGSLTTRIVGTAQTPVVSAGSGAAIYGVAGATVSDITQSFVGRNLVNTRIAFQTQRDGNYEIYSMGTDGTNQTRLTNAVGNDISPSWTGDGTKLVFSSQRDGNDEIYSMNADGSGQTRLTNNAAADTFPAVSSSGAKIAFATTRDGNTEVYSMNADGTSPIRLTNNAATDYLPSFSPDGTKIAFNTNRDGNTEIYVMNADGTGQTRLTNNAATDSAPSWSPDGSKIAFMTDRDGNLEVYTMNPDGTNVSRLTNNAASDYYPSFSPDGATIAFATQRDAGNFEIYRMDADGGNPTRLTNNAAIDYVPSWSGFYQPKYVGASGILGTDCAGFLVGQQGDANTSLLVFDTPTVGARAASRVVANTNPESVSPNLIFTITTNTGMSSLKFVNLAQSLAPVTPTLPSGTTGALVSFNASSGLVASVLPYAANRSARIKPVRSGDNATYAGHFTAVFDGAGKNLAPGGAKFVTLDAKTGKLVRFE